MPGGGYVTTYSDITERVQATAALAAANERLEQRVRERTAALTQLNAELTEAKTVAEKANLGKTRFLAAASHDLLQPLNAARLYVSSLIERQVRRPASGATGAELARRSMPRWPRSRSCSARCSTSPGSTPARSRPSAALRARRAVRALKVEFAPMAERKGLDLRIVH